MILVTRKDLSQGYQAVQPAHALAQFAVEHTRTFTDWQKNHKNLIVLAADNEDALTDLWLRAKVKGISTSVFREPDLKGQVTAIAFAPGQDTGKLTSSLPLPLYR